MASIKDVAKVCGFSTATVSKSINGHSDISEETKQKVFAAIKEVGYTPNLAARALKTKRQKKIGIVYFSDSSLGLAHEFFANTLQAFKMTMEIAGYEIAFVNHQAVKDNISFRDYIGCNGYDGVFILNCAKQIDNVMDLVNSSIPVVTIDHKFNNRTAVISDNTDGIKTLVEYAYQQGHRKIAYIHGEHFFVTECRVKSFLRTMEGLSLEVPEAYLQESRYLDAECTEQLTKTMLQGKNPPTCIIFPDDRAAVGGINAIRDLGLRIPEDISVCGYDGSFISQIMSPKLTTYQQDTQSMGEHAANNLISLIEKPKTTLVETVVVKGTLFEGGSVRKINL